MREHRSGFLSAWIVVMQMVAITQGAEAQRQCSALSFKDHAESLSTNELRSLINNVFALDESARHQLAQGSSLEARIATGMDKYGLNSSTHKYKLDKASRQIRSRQLSTAYEEVYDYVSSDVLSDNGLKAMIACYDAPGLIGSAYQSDDIITVHVYWNRGKFMDRDSTIVTGVSVIGAEFVGDPILVRGATIGEGGITQLFQRDKERSSATIVVNTKHGPFDQTLKKLERGPVPPVRKPTPPDKVISISYRARWGSSTCGGRTAWGTLSLKLRVVGAVKTLDIESIDIQDDDLRRDWVLNPPLPLADITEVWLSMAVAPGKPPYDNLELKDITVTYQTKNGQGGTFGRLSGNTYMVAQPNHENACPGGRSRVVLFRR